jgi:hypothetical protein
MLEAMVRSVMNTLRRVRSWRVAAVTAALISAIVLDQAIITAPANAKGGAKELCARPHPGVVCNHFRVDSDGPDYNVHGWLSPADDTGNHLYDWSEDNPKYTDWWFTYDEATTRPADSMFHAVISSVSDRNLLYASNKAFPINESNCYTIRKSWAIDSTTCPA